MSAVAGYGLVLPPGWVQLPLRQGSEAAVDQILDRSFAGLPRDSSGPFRRELRRRLLDQVDAARDAGGLDLYLPIDRVHDVTLPASLIVSQLDLDAAYTPEPVDVLLHLVAAAGDVAPCEVDGAVGARGDRVVGAGDGSPRSHRVDLVLAVPGAPTQWVVLAFSTVAAQRELAEVPDRAVRRDGVDVPLAAPPRDPCCELAARDTATG